MPSAPALASSGLDLVRPMASLDLERLMADLIPKLTPTKRRELRYLVRGLKTRKEIGGIPSVSAALVARAPALVGAHLWRSCVDKQRREPEPRPAFLNDVPDDVFKIIARFAAAAKATRDAPDGLRPLFLSHRRGRNVIDWCVVLNDVADVIRPDLVNGDRPTHLPWAGPEGYRVHWPRRVLMRAYFHLSRARLLWDGAPRPAALEGLADLVTRGLRGATPKRLAPRACHVTGLDMARQAFVVTRGAARGPVAPWRRYHRATFECGGDTWDVRIERKRVMRLRCMRENTGSSSDEAEFDADDDDLCLTIQKMPFEACRPTCNCAYDFPLRVAVLGPTGIWEECSKGGFEWYAVSGCWFSRDLAGWSDWVRAVDKAEADAPWDAPVRLLVTTPAAYFVS